jgi:hypothetical protein
MPNILSRKKSVKGPRSSKDSPPTYPSEITTDTTHPPPPIEPTSAATHTNPPNQTPSDDAPASGPAKLHEDHLINSSI